MDIGIMICKLVLDMNYGTIRRVIKGNIMKEKNLGLGLIFGKMERIIWVNGIIIIQKDLVYINISMGDNIQENGRIIKCMANLFGSKGKNIQGFIRMIKKKDLGFTIGPMIDSLSVFGKKGNKMGLESLLKMMYLNMVFGKMVKEKNGLKMKKNLWRN